jgi:hypothetical protein
LVEAAAGEHIQVHGTHWQMARESQDGIVVEVGPSEHDLLPAGNGYGSSTSNREGTLMLSDVTLV